MPFRPFMNQVSIIGRQQVLSKQPGSFEFFIKAMRTSPELNCHLSIDVEIVVSSINSPA